MMWSQNRRIEFLEVYRPHYAGLHNASKQRRPDVEFTMSDRRHKPTSGRRHCRRRANEQPLSGPTLPWRKEPLSFPTCDRRRPDVVWLTGVRSPLFHIIHVCGSQALPLLAWQPRLAVSVQLQWVAAGSQSPAWRDDTARSLALSTSHEALEEIRVRWFTDTGLYHAFWMWCDSAAGFDDDDDEDYDDDDYY